MRMRETKNFWLVFLIISKYLYVIKQVSIFIIVVLWIILYFLVQSESWSIVSVHQLTQYCVETEIGFVEHVSNIEILR